MVTTADSYAAFKRRLDRLLDHTSKLDLAVFGYKTEDVAWRLVQRYAELGVFEFTRASAEYYLKTGALPRDHTSLSGRILYFRDDGSISISKRKKTRLAIDALVYWALGLVAIIISLRFTNTNRPIDLIYGVSEQDLFFDAKDGRFIRFLKHGPLTPLSRGNRFVVQTTRPHTSTDRNHFRYSRIPLLTALSWSGLELPMWMGALVRHLTAPINFARLMVKCPNAVLLARDIASHSIAEALNQSNGINSVFFTNTNYFSQPLCFFALRDRKFKSHLAWYSQNNYPISYRDEEQASPIPNLGYIRVDIQWVWTVQFRNFLENICPPCKYEVVSPIIWHLPSETAIRSKGQDVYKIAIFDILPMSKLTEKDFGLIRNFYTSANMTNFLEDIIEISSSVFAESKKKVKLVLKHKRKSTRGFHDSDYDLAILSLMENCEVELQNHDTNLFDLIGGIDLVIAAPYSSPVYVAASLNKPAFWYDPTSSLEWKFGNPEIDLIQGLSQLKDRIRREISDWPHEF